MTGRQTSWHRRLKERRQFQSLLQGDFGASRQEAAGEAACESGCVSLALPVLPTRGGVAVAGPALALEEKSTAVFPSAAGAKPREAPLPLSLYTRSHLRLALGFSCVVSPQEGDGSSVPHRRLQF